MAAVKADDVEGALLRLSRQVAGQVVITRGAKGALMVGHDAESVLTVSAPTITALDPLGAGDAFKAGLLACYVAGLSLPVATAYGCLTGAMCVTARGACADPPDPERVAAFAAAHGGWLARRQRQPTVGG